MALEVKLEAFEGPLDLLLHLIEKNKVDIYDIPIAEITRQYMEYIKAMETEDMNVMSEFLVMAATLTLACALFSTIALFLDGLHSWLSRLLSSLLHRFLCWHKNLRYNSYAYFNTLASSLTALP